jgi:hypothetical protein
VPDQALGKADPAKKPEGLRKGCSGLLMNQEQPAPRFSVSNAAFLLGAIFGSQGKNKKPRFRVKADPGLSIKENYAKEIFLIAQTIIGLILWL